ncbi:hypothetical protein ACOME3_007697 [Neoechinorhynchus agilis]
MSKDEFILFQNTLGLVPIKYLKRSPSSEPYALLVSGSQDEVDKVQGWRSRVIIIVGLNGRWKRWMVVEDEVKEELEILKERADNLNKKLEKDKIICDLLNMVALVKKTENCKEVDEVIKQVQEKLMMGKRCASGEKEDEPDNKEDGLSSHGPIRKMGRHVNGRHKGRCR